MGKFGKFQHILLPVITVLILLTSGPAQALSAAERHSLGFETEYFNENDSGGCGTSANSGSAVASANLNGFVDTYGQQAYDNSIHSGVPYEFTLGQAIVESGYGKSDLTTQANNFFGIKADSSWTGATISFPTHEVVNGSTITIVASFRKYATPQDGFADHDQFLRENGRYAGAFKYSNDPLQFLAEIAKAGYATDPNYTQTVGAVIKGVQAYIATTHKWPPSSSVTYQITSPTPSAGTANAGSSNPCGTSGTSGSVAGYKNPLRDIKNLARFRIDEGVDYGGEGPVYAIGNGTVIYAQSSTGWPGGNFLSYKLTDGPAAGKVIYFAENCDISVHAGDAVTSDTVICQMHDASPHTETGWGVEQPVDLAAANTVYHEGDVTAYGVNFSAFMQAVGAPPGVNNGTPVVGTLPSGWPQW